MAETNQTYLEGYVGPQFLGDGAISRQVRRGKTNETIVGMGHGQHYEQASRGKVYYACNQAVVTFGTAGVITAAGVNNIMDYVDGALVVVPGAVLTVAGITVVGTGLISMCWSEVPISA